MASNDSIPFASSSTGLGNMSVLFEPYEFSGIKMRNRFVRSATVNNLTNEENRFTASHRKLYTDLARGGVGLIISGAHRPKREWSIGHVFQQPCLDVPGIENEMRTLVNEVHQLGAAFVSQISPPFKIHGKQVIGSATDVSLVPEPLDQRDIVEIKAAYRDAGRVLASAGCDGVQLHCCHGNVLSRMISPFFNQRNDQYGGSPNNRARIILELAQELKEGASDDFPVMIKMNSGDFRQGGMTVDDAAEIATIFVEGGIAAIEPSCGGTGASYNPSGPIEKNEWHEGYLVEYASRIKKAVNVPIMVVGGMRDLAMMEDVVATGKGDLISMCRPFIREPDLINRWNSEDRSPSTCISCDGCLKEITRSRKLRCVQVTRPDGSPKND
jgi:2,4-dienoyl-CoA reductase-like NADH-dependent reductase (Old Yellow Enzyme family)